MLYAYLLNTRWCLDQLRWQAEPEGIAARRSDMPLELEYELWEMVERVANLFRVYPAQNPEAAWRVGLLDAMAMMKCNLQPC